MLQVVVSKMAPVDRRGLLSQPQCLTARSGSGLEDLRRPEPIMSIPRSVADVIQNHVTLEVEGIDRMYLNVYQPKLQMEKGADGRHEQRLLAAGRGVCRTTRHSGCPIPQRTTQR